MDIDFLQVRECVCVCVCVCLCVCVYTLLLNAIYYYESDGMLVAVICGARDAILLTHTHICITVMN